MESIEENRSMKLEGYMLQLVDQYNSDSNETLKLDQLLAQKGFKEKLTNIYKELNKTERFKYYEILEPSVYFVGEYNGPIETTVDGEKNIYVPQAEAKLTNINTVQLSEEIMMQQEELLKEGRFFKDKDFNKKYVDTIPVVLGDSFRNSFNVGDTMKISYYMEKTNAEVIGFLKENSFLDFGDITYSMNEYMLLPSIDIVYKDSRYDFGDKIIMMDKCEGYAYVENVQQIEGAIKEIERIKEKYSFQYDIDALRSMEKYYKQKGKETQETQQVETPDIVKKSTKTQKIVLRVGMIAGVFLIVLYGFIWRDYISKFKFGNTRSVILKTKVAIIIFIQMVLLYIISYFIMLKVLGYINKGYTKELLSTPQSEVRFFLIMAYTIICIFVCRSIDKEYKNRED